MVSRINDNCLMPYCFHTFCAIVFTYTAKGDTNERPAGFWYSPFLSFWTHGSSSRQKGHICLISLTGDGAEVSVYWCHISPSEHCWLGRIYLSFHSGHWMNSREQSPQQLLLTPPVLQQISCIWTVLARWPALSCICIRIDSLAAEMKILKSNMILLYDYFAVYSWLKIVFVGSFKGPLLFFLAFYLHFPLFLCSLPAANLCIFDPGLHSSCMLAGWWLHFGIYS